jgi:hypothetical protein
MSEAIEINWYPVVYALMSLVLFGGCTYITWLNIQDTRNAGRMIPTRKRHGKR